MPTPVPRTFDPANLRDWARILPDLAQLIWRIVRDGRVPTYQRVALGAICAYVFLPFEIVPDWVPFAGQLDDIVVLTVGLRAVLRRIPQDILLEHWSGTADALEGLLATDLDGTVSSSRTGLVSGS
ncbi:MAG TPA: DUF1232 domain-containing protein [Actinomycetota bacterium]|jgi:uncharacterized membrane protein YkvA (DUF1232 family)|nr:DUF1232 domain-containing protein [Actinomycetota bacterium]